GVLAALAQQRVGAESGAPGVAEVVGGQVELAPERVELLAAALARIVGLPSARGAGGGEPRGERRALGAEGGGTGGRGGAWRCRGVGVGLGPDLRGGWRGLRRRACARRRRRPLPHRRRRRALAGGRRRFRLRAPNRRGGGTGVRSPVPVADGELVERAT